MDRRRIPLIFDMKQDMTIGKPAKTLFVFAVPMILGNLFQQFYSLVDSVIVGHFVGEEALAAVGSSFAVTMLFIAVAIGASMGASVMISQFFGAKRFQEMKRAISTALISFLVVSFLWALVGLGVKDGLLHLLRTPENIFEDASTYLQIYFLSIPFLFMYNALSATFNALGDSRTPLGFLIFSSLTNIGLDLWFVIQFHMGVAGVALATLIAQGIAAGLSFMLLIHRLRKMPDGSGEEPVSGNRWYSTELFGLMVKIAVPSIIQQSIVSVSMLMVQAVINPYGSSVVAGYSAALKIDSVAIMPMQAVGNAMSTFTAQNIGAMKQERVREGYRASYPMIFLINLAVFLVIQFFGETFLGFFLENGSGSVAMQTGMEYLHVVSITYFMLGLLMVTGSVLRGSGDLLWFLLASVANLAARVGCAYGLNGVIGIAAVWYSMPVGWLAGFAVNFFRYRQGKWMKKKLI